MTDVLIAGAAAARRAGPRGRQVPARYARRQDPVMTTYVLIPGACHGAWCFDDLAAELRSRTSNDIVPTCLRVTAAGLNAPPK